MNLTDREIRQKAERVGAGSGFAKVTKQNSTATIKGYYQIKGEGEPKGSTCETPAGRITIGSRRDSRTLLTLMQRGDTILVQISEHGGKTFANFRKWYSDGNSLKPTRQGVTIPLEALPDLHDALGTYLADMAPAALKTP